MHEIRGKINKDVAELNKRIKYTKPQNSLKL